MINTNTKLYAIFGNPVKHSLSPIMHNAAFKDLNLNCIYMAFSPEKIEDGINAMRTLNISGASITIPFKIDVMKFIDKIDPIARDIGSVNTLHNSDGKITGYNTDGTGAILAIKNRGIRIKNSKVLLIGNGGSARAIAFNLLSEGAKVTITGRNLSKINSLADDLNKKYQADTILINDLNLNFMENTDIIINTTPLGMSPHIETSPLDDSLLLKKHSVFDIVYSPDKTKLLNDAEKKGSTIIKGIDMLINQGALQFKIWTGLEAPIDVMKNSVLNKINS